MIQINSNIESHGSEQQRIFHGDTLEVLSQSLIIVRLW